MSLLQKLREWQVHFPFLQDFRFTLQFNLRAFIKKPHEQDFYGLRLIEFIENPLFIDAGSNRGESIQSMKLMTPSAKIIGFEANTEIINKMWAPLLKDVEIKNVGLGDTNQSATLYVPYYRQWLHDGYTSFDKNSIEPLLKLIFTDYQSKHLTIKELPFKTQPLDDFNLAPDFIKIDVQGFEYKVLLGAEKTLQKHLPVLLIEGLSDEIINFLKPLSYEFFSYEAAGFKQGIAELNTYCVPMRKYKTTGGAFKLRSRITTKSTLQSMA